MNTSPLAWRQATVLACLLPLFYSIAPATTHGGEPILRTLSVPETTQPGPIGHLDLPRADQILSIRSVTEGPVDVDPESLEVYLQNGFALDYETRPSITQILEVTYQAKKDDVDEAFEEYVSQAGGSASKAVETLQLTLQLQVTDIQESPSILGPVWPLVLGHDFQSPLPLSWSITDPEGDSLKFQLVGSSGPLQIDQQTGAISLSRQRELAEILPIRVQVSDQQGGTIELAQTIVVLPPMRVSIPAQQPDILQMQPVEQQPSEFPPTMAANSRQNGDSEDSASSALAATQPPPDGSDRNSTLNSEWLAAMLASLGAMFVGCFALMLTVRWLFSRSRVQQPELRVSPETELSQAELEELLWSKVPQESSEPESYPDNYTDEDVADEIEAANRQHALGLVSHDFSRELNSEWRNAPSLAVCHDFEIDADGLPAEADDRVVEYAGERVVEYAAEELEADEFARELAELDEHRTLPGFRLTDGRTDSAAESVAAGFDPGHADSNRDPASESAIEEWLRRVAPGFETASSASFRMSSNSFNLSSHTFGLLDEIEEAQVEELPRERALPEGYREHLRNELESFRKLAISAAEIRMLEEEQEEQTKSWSPAVAAVTGCSLVGLVCIWFNWFGLTAPLLGWPLIGVGAVILTRNLGSWLPLWLRLRQRSLSVREYLEDPRR